MSRAGVISTPPAPVPSKVSAITIAKRSPYSRRAYSNRGGKLIGAHRTCLQRREPIELHTTEHGVTASTAVLSLLMVRVRHLGIDLTSASWTPLRYGTNSHVNGSLTCIKLTASFGFNAKLFTRLVPVYRDRCE